MLEWATSASFCDLGAVFHAAVHGEPSPYTPAQREAWSPALRSGAFWAERLSGQDVLLIRRDGRIQGFMSATAGGYVDMAFILPDARGQGYFSALYREIETHVRQNGGKRMSTHASTMAQPAFHRHGFRVIQHETVERMGQHLARAEMEKLLT
jgi:putative acetyltransferase